MYRQSRVLPALDSYTAVKISGNLLPATQNDRQVLRSCPSGDFRCGLFGYLLKPLILTVEQYYIVLELLPQPYRTMVVVSQCLGLRAEEVLALHWADIDLERLIVRVSRAVVHGRIKAVKTDYSEDELPLDPDFASVLLDWRARAPKSKLVFPSHITGRHFHA